VRIGRRREAGEGRRRGWPGREEAAAASSRERGGGGGIVLWKEADHFLLIWILLNWIHFHPHLDGKESPGGWRRVGDMLEFVLQMQFDFLLDHCQLERPKYLTVFLSFGSWSIAFGLYFP
jgi:hypothetical protein